MKRHEVVHARVGSSFISFEQAELNLQREVGNDAFDQTKEKARSIWNETLSRVKVEGGEVDQVRTFYSCLYRTVLFPNRLYEVNKDKEIVHWSQSYANVLTK